MKTTLNELVQKADSLEKLLNKELPIKTAFKLGKLANKIKEELIDYYKLRDKLIEKYGSEKNGQIIIDQNDKEAVKNFMKENTELLSLEITLPYEPIKISELGELKLSSVDMGNLLTFFEE